jgi:hypothetical protein
LSSRILFLAESIGTPKQPFRIFINLAFTAWGITKTYSTLFPAMKRIIVYCLCTLVLISSCTKERKPDPGPFFISYTTQGADFHISPGSEYLFKQGTSIATDAGGNHQFSPITMFFPASPHNENIYRIGFIFSSGQTGSNVDWVNLGNSIFQQKAYSICYTGVNYANFLEGLSCPGGATIYYTPDNGKLLNSASVVQPAGSYFIIDTVTDFHSTDTRANYDFDKIISGRFQCRVYNPEKHTEYADLSSGKFRMPIWRNGFR